MISNFLKSTTVKLIILVCTVLVTLIFSSFLFNTQIDNLKKQVDNIYFGNLIPIVKLQIILDNYQEIISCKTNKHNCIIEKEKNVILQEWNYYYQAFKNKDERVVVDTINAEIINSFNEKRIEVLKNILNRVDFLIQYETQIAFKERKKFLEDYENMKSYLFYSILTILLLSFIVIAYIILQVIKKDKQLTILNTKYKMDSITDSMTKLHNRKYFDNIFDNMPFIANANNWRCAFIMVDIDYFKQ